MTPPFEVSRCNLESEPVSQRFTCAFDEENPFLSTLDKLGGKGHRLKEMTLLGLPVPLVLR